MTPKLLIVSQATVYLPLKAEDMGEEENRENLSSEQNLENEKVSGIQRKIEEKIAEDEKSLQGEVLSGELSKDRTHMSEHRTRMSEHRTGLSEHRTQLS